MEVPAARSRVTLILGFAAARIRFPFRRGRKPCLKPRQLIAAALACRDYFAVTVTRGLQSHTTCSPTKGCLPVQSTMRHSAADVLPAFVMHPALRSDCSR